MIAKSKISISQWNSFSFADWLFRTHRNKSILWASAVIIIVQFAIFKYIYPFASYIYGDSYCYLEGANKNMSINTYMIGYSMFLRLFSVFTRSDVILTAFQYGLIETSALFLLFTVFFFYKTREAIQTILFFFVLFNPLFLYLGNLVSSDGYFLALSMIWFGLLIWIIERPTIWIIIWHAVAISIAFTVRYNALIYLLISLIAFVLSNQRVKTKIIGFGIATLCIGLFVFHTGNRYKELTGSWQYSPFAGWQWANNAMYAYRYVDSADRKPVSKKFEALDNNIKAYFDSTRDIKKYPTEAAMASTFYMWSPGLPLFNYRNKLFKGDTTATELKKWASMGPLYKAYGIYIIGKYPIYYIRYFLAPNFLKYYTPPGEFLTEYNSGRPTVDPLSKTWFTYKSLSVFTRYPKLEPAIIGIYPIFCGIINLVMAFSLLSFLLMGGHRKRDPFGVFVLLGASIWLLNAGFTIFASSAALRYQAFPLIISNVYSLVLIDWLLKFVHENTDVKSKPVQPEILPA